MRKAELRPWARGMVAVNKELTTNNIHVTPIEVLPQLNGEINAVSEELTHKGIDADGNTYEVKANTGNTIECKWLPCGSNRTTAPDVRRGERVMIYKYADADIYYWQPLGLDDHLRRLETIIYRFSNLPDGLSDDELTDENCYFLSISTHTGLVELITNKSNKEAFAYTFQLNTKESVFLLTDDIENYIQLESEERKITLENADKSRLVLDKKNAFLFAPEDIYMESGRDTFIKTGRRLKYNVGGDLTRNVAGNYTNNIDGNYSTFATNVGFNMGTFTIDGKLVTAGTSEFQQAMRANGITSPATISGPKGSI